MCKVLLALLTCYARENGASWTEFKDYLKMRQQDLFVDTATDANSGAGSVKNEGGGGRRSVRRRALILD